MRRILSIVTIIVMSFIGLIHYSEMRYQESEDLAYSAVTTTCLTNGLGNVLNEYYKTHKEYPKEQLFVELAITHGYPNNLGCGSTAIKIKKYLVNTFNKPFVYDVISKDEVIVHSAIDYRKLIKKVHLVKGVMITTLKRKVDVNN